MPESRLYTLLWSDFAVGDVDRITSYIALESPTQAQRLWQNLRATVGRLAHFPLRCRIVPELKDIGVETYREALVEPYRILFRIQKKTVWILGVFDARRDLEEIILARIVGL